MALKKKYRIVLKVGSNVLSDFNGGLAVERIEKLSEQISILNKQGIEVILISSGAVASGRSIIKLSNKIEVVSQRQVFAAVGQIKLINIYAGLFEKHNLLCAQVLVTKEDFRDREHYINMKNCITVLIKNNVIPVLNENDVVSVNELMFTDNDELAGLVSSMTDADKLIILSNIDGIYEGSPADAGAKVIAEIEYGNRDFEKYISNEKSNFGRGGMLTKCNIACKVASLGIPVQIANGKTENILLDILAHKSVGTLFKPKRTTSSVKKWVAHSEGFVKASVYIDSGAEKALQSAKPTSLLPVGIIKISGTFKKGDVIKIINEKGFQIGVGKTQYNSDKAVTLLKRKNEKALIHYDYLFLHDAK